jgi:hypothetical protein
MVEVQISNPQLCSAVLWDWKSRHVFTKGSEIILNEVKYIE